MEKRSTKLDDVIRAAYAAQGLTPDQEEFRTKRRKAIQNPAQRTKTLNQVITHMHNPQKLAWAKQKASAILLSEDAAAYVTGLDSQHELREFLAAVGLFLKTTETRRLPPMTPFSDGEEQRLSQAATTQLAWTIVQETPDGEGPDVKKLMRLVEWVRGAQNRWTCLAVLAQFYPLKGMSPWLLNRLTTELGRLELGVFRELTSQVLVFYRAQQLQKQHRG
jgi:hypothetical protein